MITAGLVSPGTVRAATFGVLGAAGLIGLWLVTVGGWPILAIGVLSLICAIVYTGGPFPLGYHGLGDLFVFIFFGLVAVNGTVWLQTGTLVPAAILASLPVGWLATAIIVVNNLRDIKTDALAGKRTLAVRLGARRTRTEYTLLVLLTFVGLLPLVPAGAPGALIAMVVLPLAIHEILGVLARNGTALNQSLAGTARLHLIFGALLTTGLVI
jgi:1,4-dihydroxy-2-naphthoate octaprenyltransferase